MKVKYLLTLLVAGLASAGAFFWGTHGASPKVHRGYGQLPIVFEENLGQAEPSALLVAHSGNAVLFLRRGEVELAVRKPGQTVSMRMEFAGANQNTEIRGEQPTAGTSNYFVGKDSRAWHTGVKNYARAVYREIYRGTDLIFHGEDGKLEYDFLLAAGADPGAIRLKFPGVVKTRLTTEGNLILDAGGVELVQHRPIAYQEGVAGRTEVASNYVVSEEREVRVALGAYDHKRAVVIDPVLTYSTYLGGNGDDAAAAIAVDSTGAAYVTGQTASTDFPAVNPIQASCGAGCVGSTPDVFVTKVSADGKSILYSTYLGGNGMDLGRAIAVDPDGNAYVTGLTASADFPTTQGAFQTACMSHACQSAFVAKLNPSGNQLVYSTYLGGSFPSEDGRGIAVDDSRHAYVAGITSSSDFPTTPGAYSTVCGTHGECSSFIGDAFVSKLSVDGSALDYSTFLGGGSGDEANAIAVDSAGRAYVAGRTFSTDFPTTGGAPQSTFGGGNTDAFVTRLTADGSGLDYSTYLGGSGDDQANGVAVDQNSNTYVAGNTSSQDFPTVPGSFQANAPGLPDAFVTEITQAGRGLIYSTYLGGQLSETGDAIAVSPNGNAFVAGSTMSAQFPTSSPTQATCNSCPTLFPTGYVTKLTADGSKPVFSTFLGGSFQDAAKGIAIDANGDAYVAGLADSTDFPTTPGTIQGSRSTPGDGFVAKMSGLKLPVVTNPVTFVNFPIPQLVGTTSAQPEVLTLQNVGDAPLHISSMTASANFGVTNNCNGSVTGPGSCAITITFTPTAIGPSGGGVTITDDAADSPQGIQMSGIGVDFGIAAASGGSTSASITAGGTANYKLALVPAGFVGQVALSCSGAPANAKCSATPPSASLDGINPAPISVNVSTMANGGVIPWGIRIPNLYLLGLAACLLVIVEAALVFSTRRAVWMRPSFSRGLAVAAGVLILCGAVVSGCGGGSSTRGTPRGSYNLVVTGSAGGANRTLGLTLMVN